MKVICGNVVMICGIVTLAKEMSDVIYLCMSVDVCMQ